MEAAAEAAILSVSVTPLALLVAEEEEAVGEMLVTPAMQATQARRQTRPLSTLCQ